MREFTYVVNDPIGIHVRPAGLLVKEVKKFQSTITVTKDGREVNGLKLMGLMGLCVKNGEKITVKADGADEDAAIAALEVFFQENL